jgi:hypothetical protein
VSRRRNPQRQAMPGIVVNLVCTDRGRHAPVRLQEQPIIDRRRHLPGAALQFGDCALTRLDDGGATYKFRCDRCGRDQRRRDDRLSWTEILDRLYSTQPGRQRYTLDLSYLD